LRKTAGREAACQTRGKGKKPRKKSQQGMEKRDHRGVFYVVNRKKASQPSEKRRNP